MEEVEEKIYWAPSTKGFYSSLLHEGNMPVDSLEISKERHMELMLGQAEGVIKSGPDGYPIIAPLTEEDKREATVQEKLAMAGISMHELKAALGL